MIEGWLRFTYTVYSVGVTIAEFIIHANPWSQTCNPDSASLPNQIMHAEYTLAPHHQPLKHETMSPQTITLALDR